MSRRRGGYKIQSVRNSFAVHIAVLTCDSLFQKTFHLKIRFSLCCLSRADSVNQQRRELTGHLPLSTMT